MTTDYTIVRAQGNSHDLEARVRAKVAEGWEPTGAPFYNDSSREWMQSMTRNGAAPPAGQVKLKEPHRSDPRFPR